MPLSRITAASISDGTVVAADIADGAVTGPKLGATSINANNIVNGTITGAKIALGTITGDDIAVNQITGNLLTANCVSGNNIVSGVSLTSPTISGNTAFDTNTLFVDATSDKIGIGTTSPQMKLEINGGIRVQGIANPTSGSGMELAYDGTQGIIQTYSNRATLASVPVYFVNGQIKFPATQNASSDANTLDDYEEGTWTPSVGGNATYTLQQGHYVKIGQLVYIFADMEINSIGTGNTSSITNAPFTSFDSNTPTGYPINISYFNALANSITWLTAYIADNATTISFAGNSTAATSIQNNGFAVFGNSTRIVLSGCYRTSA